MNLSNTKYHIIKTTQNILYAMLMLNTLLLSIPLLLLIIIEYPFGNNISFNFFKLIYWFLEKIYFNSQKIYDGNYLEILNNKKINKKKLSFVFMANHQSYSDGLIAHLIPNKVCGIAIGYVSMIPVIGQIIKLLNFVFDKKKGNCVNQIVSKLKADMNTSLLIFPEGERLFDGKFHPEKIKSGGFITALEMNYDIVPVYLTFGNTTRDREYKYIWNSKNKIIIGKIINTCGKTLGEIKTEYINEMLRLEEKYIIIKKID